jgi:hypothetical protein
VSTHGLLFQLASTKNIPIKHVGLVQNGQFVLPFLFFLSLMYQDFSSFFSAEMVSSASDLKAGTQQYLIPVKYNFSSFIVALREIPSNTEQMHICLFTDDV